MEWFRRLAMVFSLAAMAAACFSAFAASRPAPQPGAALRMGVSIRQTPGPGADALTRLGLEEGRR
jgi:hypothetical protein